MSPQARSFRKRNRAAGDSLRLLDELEPAPGPAPGPGPGPAGPASAEHAELWRTRYHNAPTRLRQAGIELPARADQYTALRERWDRQLRTLAHDMAYPWSQIDRTLP